MARQSREEYLQKKRDYYRTHREYYAEYWKQHRERKLLNNRNYIARYNKAHPEQYREMLNRQHRGYRRRLKIAVLSQYSEGSPKCKVCGERRMACLTIDHIKGNGRKHKRELGIVAGSSFYYWLKKNDYPKDFQVLCMNCQWIKRYEKGEYSTQV